MCNCDKSYYYFIPFKFKISIYISRTNFPNLYGKNEIRQEF